jgi:hypothetical protein
MGEKGQISCKELQIIKNEENRKSLLAYYSNNSYRQYTLKNAKNK